MEFTLDEKLMILDTHGYTTRTMNMTRHESMYHNKQISTQEEVLAVFKDGKMLEFDWRFSTSPFDHVESVFKKLRKAVEMEAMLNYSPRKLAGNEVG